MQTLTIAPLYAAHIMSYMVGVLNPFDHTEHKVGPLDNHKLNRHNTVP